jgi:hypothetical protein
MFALVFTGRKRRGAALGANLFGMFSLNLPQNRHPERSASQIYRVTQRLAARSRRACPERSRRNPEGAYLAHAVRSFSTTEAREQGGTHLMARGTSFHAL